MQRIFLNVGYELSEKQLRGYFVKFGVLSDLYLPKHANGRNKGYGFATYASSESLALALQHPKHVVNGITVQVKRAGPRPPDIPQDIKPAIPKVGHVPFGQGPRIYVGGVHQCLTETRLHEHFSKWGSISDIYFPGARGQKRSNYCFVTFDDRRNAERACNESGRNLDGWSLESICMADERKVELDHSIQGALPALSPVVSAAAGNAAEAAATPSYALWLQLQYQQQLAALQLTMSAAAAHEASHLAQKASSQDGSPAISFRAPSSVDTLPDLYSQPASLYNNQPQHQAASLPPQWLSALSSGDPASAVHPNYREGLGRTHMGAAPGGVSDCYGMLAQQSMLYAAEQEQQLVAARLHASASLAEVGSGYWPAPLPHLTDPTVGFATGLAHLDGRSSVAHSFLEAGYNFSGAGQDHSAFNVLPQEY